MCTLRKLSICYDIEKVTGRQLLFYKLNPKLVEACPTLAKLIAFVNVFYGLFLKLSNFQVIERIQGDSCLKFQKWETGSSRFQGALCQFGVLSTAIVNFQSETDFVALYMYVCMHVCMYVFY